MILDPSGRYLPANCGRKQTSLVRKLSQIYRYYCFRIQLHENSLLINFHSQYPNQLEPYETIFRFSRKDAAFYHGVTYLFFFFGPHVYC